MKIPFLDLVAQDREVGADVRAALADVLAGQAFVLGTHVERFEAAVAEYCGVPHAIGVASGTDALLLSLGGLGVGPGVSVLTTPFSFWATASAIVRLGARPIFADIDPATFNLHPAAVEAALAATHERVAGILPVHLFGRLAPMGALAALAERRGLWVVEDAAQAIGARADGTSAGAFGRAGCLSFYPTKNLGALGDGGMVLTRDATLAAHVRQERHQGHSSTPYVHASLGMCSRLDAVQAAALGAKLPRLDGWNARRRTIAARYTRLLEDAGLAGAPGAPLVRPISPPRASARRCTTGCRCTCSRRSPRSGSAAAPSRRRSAPPPRCSPSRCIRSSASGRSRRSSRPWPLSIGEPEGRGVIHRYVQIALCLGLPGCVVIDASQSGGRPDPVRLGQPVTYTIALRTLNADTGIVLTDVPPAGATLVSATASQGTCTGAAPVVCSIGAIDANVQATADT